MTEYSISRDAFRSVCADARGMENGSAEYAADKDRAEKTGKHGSRQGEKRAGAPGGAMTEEKSGRNAAGMPGKSRKRGRNPLAVMCSLTGTLVLAALVLACLPMVMPGLLGFGAYTVVSGSMEPAIPTGSLVYIAGAEPEGIKTGDIIAFHGGEGSGAVITHRVVENRVVMGEFVTKGDANSAQDMKPVPYSDFMGRVAWTIPEMGRAAAVLTSREGKIAAVCAVAAAVLLQVLSAFLDRGRGGTDRDR